jgi:hypothetical protein
MSLKRELTMDLPELETLYLTKLMRRDAKIWYRHFYGGQQASDDDSKNQDEAPQQQKQDAL